MNNEYVAYIFYFLNFISILKLTQNLICLFFEIHCLTSCIQALSDWFWISFRIFENYKFNKRSNFI